MVVVVFELPGAELPGLCVVLPATGPLLEELLLLLLPEEVGPLLEELLLLLPEEIGPLLEELEVFPETGPFVVGLFVVGVLVVVAPGGSKLTVSPTKKRFLGVIEAVGP